MLTCYAEKRACYSLISYKTKKTQSCTNRSRAETSNRSSPAESFIARDGVLEVHWTSVSTDRSGTKIRTVRVRQDSFIYKRYPFRIPLYIRRARDGTRTRDPDLGKVVLHQLSHSRIKSAIHKHMDTILYEKGFVNRKKTKSQKNFKLYMLLTQ